MRKEINNFTHYASFEKICKGMEQTTRFEGNIRKQCDHHHVCMCVNQDAFRALVYVYIVRF